jgi:hypothetical protein
VGQPSGNAKWFLANNKFCAGQPILAAAGFSRASARGTGAPKESETEHNPKACHTVVGLFQESRRSLIPKTREWA